MKRFSSNLKLPNPHFQIDIIFGEPHFSINFLPWHNLLFWFSAQKFLGASPKPTLTPIKAELWAVPVHYRDLWKIRAPVGIVEGFDLGHFDKAVMVSSLNDHTVLNLLLLLDRNVFECAICYIIGNNALVF